MPSKIIKGHEVLFDQKDRPLVESRAWSVTAPQHGSRYILHKRTLLHRLLLNAPEDMMVDHMNHNGLDNRRRNIRLCTHEQNCFNARPRKRASSIYKGVYWNKNRNIWVAQIAYKLEPIFLGHFQYEEEAAEAYNDAAINYFGDFAFINDDLEDEGDWF